MTACELILYGVAVLAALAALSWWAHRRDLRRKFYKGKPYKGDP